MNPTHSDIDFVNSNGTRYWTSCDGSRRRYDPKPWRGKSERRKVIKARREDRALAAANLKS